jgi:type I restriction enzyme, S subunit
VREKDNMPKHWQLKKLGEVCKFVRGPFGGSLKKEIFKNDGFAVYEQQHAIYNQFSEIRYFIDEHKFNEMSRFELNSGDLIMSCSGTMGKISIVPKNIKKGIINQALLKLSPTNELSIVYLKMWMDSMTFQKSLKSFSKGAAIQNVASVSVLKNIEIPLPPLPEQQAIASKIEELFSELDKGVENLKMAQKQLKVYRQSLLKWAFEGKLTNKIIKDGELPKGWKWVKLGSIATKVTDGEHITPRRTSEGFLLLSARNIQNGYLALENVDYVPEDEYLRIIKRCNPEPGDILISCSGTIGRVCRVPKDLKFVMVRSVALVKLDWNKYSSKFYEYLFQSPLLQKHIEKSKKATAQANLFLGPINSLDVIICPIEEQELIVSELESKLTVCDKIEETISQSLQQAETLRQSILKRAFEGKLIEFKELITSL